MPEPFPEGPGRIPAIGRRETHRLPSAEEILASPRGRNGAAGGRTVAAPDGVGAAARTTVPSGAVRGGADEPAPEEAARAEYSPLSGRRAAPACRLSRRNGGCRHLRRGQTKHLVNVPRRWRLWLREASAPPAPVAPNTSSPAAVALPTPERVAAPAPPPTPEPVARPTPAAALPPSEAAVSVNEPPSPPAVPATPVPPRPAAVVRAAEPPVPEPEPVVEASPSVPRPAVRVAGRAESPLEHRGGNCRIGGPARLPRARTAMCPRLELSVSRRDVVRGAPDRRQGGDGYLRPSSALRRDPSR